VPFRVRISSSILVEILRHFVLQNDIFFVILMTLVNISGDFYLYNKKRAVSICSVIPEKILCQFLPQNDRGLYRITTGGQRNISKENHGNDKPWFLCIKLSVVFFQQPALCFPQSCGKVHIVFMRIFQTLYFVPECVQLFHGVVTDFFQ